MAFPEAAYDETHALCIQDQNDGKTCFGIMRKQGEYYQLSWSFNWMVDFLSDSFSPDSPDLSQFMPIESDFEGLFGTWKFNEIVLDGVRPGINSITAYRMLPKRNKEMLWENDHRFEEGQPATVWIYSQTGKTPIGPTWRKAGDFIIKGALKIEPFYAVLWIVTMAWML